MFDVMKTVCAVYRDRRHLKVLALTASVFSLLTTFLFLGHTLKDKCSTANCYMPQGNSTGVSNKTTVGSIIQQVSQFIPDHRDRCLPFPLKVPPGASLFHCNTSWHHVPPSNCSRRLQARLVCSQKSAEIIYEWVSLRTSPTMYDMEDECLARVIADRCTTQGLIPNVLHYVNFDAQNLTQHGLLSVISAFRFAQPCLILFHVNKLLAGEHWEVLLRLIPNIVYVIRLPPAAIFGHVIKVVEHKADVARLEAVMKFGGIYSDLDHIVLRPLKELLNHSVVMGTEHPDQNFGNGFFLGKPRAAFLQLWYDSYRTFDDRQWSVHSTIIPFKLYKNNTNLGVHVVDSFFRPNWRMIDALFYSKKYDWQKLHGVHLYVRLHKKYFVNGTLETRQGSLGEVTRHVLYGKRDACLANRTNVTPVRWTAS